MFNTFSIKDDNTFKKLINKGNWYGGNYIVLYVLQNDSDKNYLGLGVSKKVGKAFKRNQVKRLIRESYKNIEENIKFGYNLLFVCKSKSNFDNITFSDINRDVNYLLKKAGILIEENSN